jgi:4-hydroxy-L-threonine phosphate dehydrogenase PdxA
MRQLAHRYAAGAAAVTRPTIAVTIGDPNGIGPEIAVKAAAKMLREGGPAIVLVGDEFVVRFYADHDQGHIPVKLLAGRNSAALSIGAGLLFCGASHFEDVVAS